MDRRRMLATAVGAATAMVAGCLGSGAGGSHNDSPDPAEDPFPTALDPGERGAANETIIVSASEDANYEQGAVECALAVKEGVRDHLVAQFGEHEEIHVGHDPDVPDIDGVVVTVTLRTATYNRQGEVIDSADVEFDELLAATPPTGYIRAGVDKQQCAVPIYAYKTTGHVD